MRAGREVYNRHCYFCHGYNGDADTVAAGVLDPKPRDFTGADGLDRSTIETALGNGRPGTAMRPFSGRLTEGEMRAVAEFVMQRFVYCAGANTAYHTEENGWPNHQQRYGAANPFAVGEIPLDIAESDLSPTEMAGLRLFRSSCATCHFGRTAEPEGEEFIVKVSESRNSNHGDHGAAQHDDYDTPTIHDIAPTIENLTAQEQEGERLYAAACAECHAADGTGQNWIGKFLQPNPTDFTSEEFANSFDLQRFIAQTQNFTSGTAMPSFGGVLTTDEIAAIAAYVRKAFVDRVGKD